MALQPQHPGLALAHGRAAPQSKVADGGWVGGWVVGARVAAGCSAGRPRPGPPAQSCHAVQCSDIMLKAADVQLLGVGVATALLLASGSGRGAT